MQSNLHEENRGAGEDQAFYPPGEGWKTQRECTSGRHASSVGRGQRIISLRFNRGSRELRLCPLDSATQPSYQFQTYRSGSGTVGKLRCPALSTARTAKITLSFDSGSVQLVLSPHDWTCSQAGLVVARQTTSYSAADEPGDASQVKVESFSRFFVTIRTLAGGAGADAREASVAAFNRATAAT